LAQRKWGKWDKLGLRESHWINRTDKSCCWSGVRIHGSRGSSRINNRRQRGRSRRKGSEGIRHIPLPVGNIDGGVGSTVLPVLTAIGDEDLVASMDATDHLKTSTLCGRKCHKPDVGTHTTRRGVRHGPNTTKEGGVNKAIGGNLETVHTQSILRVSTVILDKVQNFPKILHQTGA
jgi:hypothetical protein